MEIQEQIKTAFLQECSMNRLKAIVGEKRANSFLSDFIVLAQQTGSSDYRQIAKCCIEIASMNLPILKQVGQAYIVPRSGSLTVEIGYKGWLVLAKRAGIAVRSYPIFEGDFFSFEVDGFEQKFSFKPLDSNLVENKTASWIENNLKFIAVVTKDLQTGIVSSNLVALETIKKMREVSTAKNSPAYRDWLLEMYQAKAIKYVLKRLPIDTLDDSIFKAFEQDDKTDIENNQRQKVEITPKNSTLDAFKQTQEQVINNEDDVLELEILS